MNGTILNFSTLGYGATILFSLYLSGLLFRDLADVSQW
ncbi:hypothetical protein JCM19239_6378 [Vibrio variabilis]|uniref:Uncharacterized protein n=1 Tax=Vibrio variabilis TaxID=990271 RepID=A0ABQ0JQ52_9VIBR|nr:hypothetical protein JCM19239_6378 [Vibrio variabilis]